ncbi:MAG: hypothetical protein K5681_02060 [Treponema sp.]|nr:hypothetical protein [Treponema sp.]
MQEAFVFTSSGLRRCECECFLFDRSSFLTLLASLMGVTAILLNAKGLAIVTKKVMDGKFAKKLIGGRNMNDPKDYIKGRKRKWFYGDTASLL